MAVCLPYVLSLSLSLLSTNPSGIVPPAALMPSSLPLCSQRSDSHAPSKAAVKRTPTTVMLGRARHRLSSVLTGLISHDVRLTQRIVDLARDPVSYFGNLVSISVR